MPNVKFEDVYANAYVRESVAYLVTTTIRQYPMLANSEKDLEQELWIALARKLLDHFFIFQKNSLHLKMANFSSLKRRSIFTSRKILREKLELHSASKKSLNIAKMVEKRFELPTSTHDLSYEKIRLADCHKIPIFF